MKASTKQIVRGVVLAMITLIAIAGVVLLTAPDIGIRALGLVAIAIAGVMMMVVDG